jgi:tetratricopeptide (TPR) repeat protein
MRSAISLCVAFAIAGFLTSPAHAEREVATTAESKAIVALLQQKNPDDAYDRAEAQRDANPNSAEAHFIFGWSAGDMAQSSSVFTKLGYAKEVRSSFERALELEPTHVEAITGLIQFHMQAPGIAGGDEAQIPKLLTQLASFNPGAALRFRGSIQMSKKDLPGAEALLKQALALNAGDGDAVGVLIGLYQQTNRLSEGKAVVAAALLKAPADFKVRYQAGKLAALTGQDLEGGIAHLDAVLVAKPRSVPIAGAHWRRGQILEKLGRKADAIAALELALKANDSKEIKADLARMKKAG